MCWKHWGAPRVEYFDFIMHPDTSKAVREAARTVWNRTYGRNYICFSCLKAKYKNLNIMSVDSAVKLLEEK